MTFYFLFTQTLMAFGGTIAFALLFGVPRPHFLFCGITGGLGWLCYQLCLGFHTSVVVATLVASAFLAVLSRALSTIRKTPSTMFLICGIFTLVPGAGIYYTAYYLITGDIAAAGTHGMTTLKAALTIALGIIFAYSLPARLFGWKKKK